ncbi:MAG: LUD domain-containing protein [Chromatiales bacterium]|nr:LUD domain-containing protein [Chromatiales bacterium]
MSDARESILAALRLAASRAAPVERGGHFRPPAGGDVVEAFVLKVPGTAASLERLPNAGAVPSAVDAYRLKLGLNGPVAIAPALAKLEWPAELPTAPIRQAELAVTVAQAGIAETGTLLLTSGPETPTTLNFLPDHALVVLNTTQIVADLDAALATLDPDAMPRAVNFVTGPSRTADVEQTIQLGAHGPRSLHILLLTSA